MIPGKIGQYDSLNPIATNADIGLSKSIASKSEAPIDLAGKTSGEMVELFNKSAGNASIQILLAISEAAAAKNLAAIEAQISILSSSQLRKKASHAAERLMGTILQNGGTSTMEYYDSEIMKVPPFIFSLLKDKRGMIETKVEQAIDALKKSIASETEHQNAKEIQNEKDLDSIAGAKEKLDRMDGEIKGRLPFFEKKKINVRNYKKPKNPFKTDYTNIVDDYNTTINNFSKLNTKVINVKRKYEDTKENIDKVRSEIKLANETLDEIDTAFGIGSQRMLTKLSSSIGKKTPQYEYYPPTLVNYVNGTDTNTDTGKTRVKKSLFKKDVSTSDSPKKPGYFQQFLSYAKQKLSGAKQTLSNAVSRLSWSAIRDAIKNFFNSNTSVKTELEEQQTNQNVTYFTQVVSRRVRTDNQSE